MVKFVFRLCWKSAAIEMDIDGWICRSLLKGKYQRTIQSILGSVWPIFHRKIPMF